MKQIILIFCFFLVSSTSGYAETKSIDICGFNWAPYIGENLERFGFTADIVMTAFERAGYKVKMEIFPWERAKKYLEDGTCDVLVDMYFTKERAQEYSYPRNPISYNRYSFFALKDNDNVQEILDIENIKNLRVGILKGGSYGTTFDLVKITLPNITKRITEPKLLALLIRKQIDILPIDEKACKIYTQTRGMIAYENLKKVESHFFTKNYLFPLFNKIGDKYKQKIKDYDNSMDQMKNDGTLKNIYDKHHALYGEE